MTDGQAEQIMDHAAELQRRVDQLSTELLLITLAVLALATLVGWKLWHP